jgi:hypothetical protein
MCLAKLTVKTGGWMCSRLRRKMPTIHGNDNPDIERDSVRPEASLEHSLCSRASELGRKNTPQQLLLGMDKIECSRANSNKIPAQSS